MPTSPEGLHERTDDLGPDVLDRHRAIASLREELEAVDWYDQRVHAASDPELRAILEHNRDEEKEHAAMVLEWLRRHDPALDRELRAQLFKEGPIGHAEKSAPPASDGSLGLGGLNGGPE